MSAPKGHLSVLSMCFFTKAKLNANSTVSSSTDEHCSGFTTKAEKTVFEWTEVQVQSAVGVVLLKNYAFNIK